MKRECNILIVDDEQVILDLLSTELAERGYQCSTVKSSEQALIELSKQHFDAIFLDIRLPGKSGIDALRIISSRYPESAVIMMTGINEVDTAVEAMKLGASDYITKPFDLERIEECLYVTLKNRELDINRSQIDAIAQGIQMKFTGSDFSEVIIETVQLAKKIGIPDKEVDKWAKDKEKDIFVLKATHKPNLSSTNWRNTGAKINDS